MRIKLLTIIFAFLTVLNAQTDLEKGIEWYNKRAEGSVGAKAAAEPINNAIAFLEKAITNPEFEREAGLYLLKSYYYRGKFVDSEKDEKKADFQKGKDLGEKLMKKYPDAVGFRYWYLANLGSWSEEYGIFAAAKEGVADIMKEQSEIIIDLDPEYEDGGGYFMLGAVHYKSPYIPFFLSWPKNDKAIKWLKKAVATGKATPTQKVYLANALYKGGRKKEAIAILEEVVSTPPSEAEPVEDMEKIEEARELLKKYR
ncbi:MAG: hypothetical protein GXO92_04620 [FCB group bacterium]|nr:hypothetical protein [FCB group bacterium]